MTWLTGWELISADTGTPGSFIAVPPRVVLHSTEGSTLAGAVGAYRSRTFWPHLTVSFEEQRRAQHYPLDVAARALRHDDGTVETNRAHAIQIEIVGFATQSPDWSGVMLDWLRTEVLDPVRAATGTPAVTVEFVPYPQSWGTHAFQRMTPAEWLAFSGVCGHQHVPGNDHGDPGAVDIARLIEEPEVTSPVGLWRGERYDVFVIGTDGQLYQRWWDGQVWHDYAVVLLAGGPVSAGLDVTAGPGDSVHLLARGPTGDAVHAWWGGSPDPHWYGWESLGGVLL